MQITEYNYYDATLSITIATQRPEAAPSTVLAAATLHEEYAAQVRGVLREYKRGLDSYLSYYEILKIHPAGGSRDIDRDFNQDLTSLSFMIGIGLTAAAHIADERLVFAFERNIEKAVRDLFAANGLPDLYIPGDDETLGESYIQIKLSMGSASNLSLWNVAPS